MTPLRQPRPLAARLLAGVHCISASARLPDVPPRTLDWFNAFLPADSSARRTLARLRSAEGDLTQGVIYGDPSPEILLEPDATPALIDWGTPSWGPLLYDAAAWARFFAQGRKDRFEHFINRYQQLSPVKPTEFDLLHELVELASSAFDDRMQPRPPRTVCKRRECGLAVVHGAGSALGSPR